MITKMMAHRKIGSKDSSDQSAKLTTVHPMTYQLFQVGIQLTVPRQPVVMVVITFGLVNPFSLLYFRASV
jgi:hypothetical protein